VIEEFEYTGRWWLPDNPDKKIHGRLTFNQREGAILQLDGCFTDDPEIKELFHPEIVNGVSSSGIDITLHQCLGQHLSIYSAGGSTSRLHAHQVLTNVHFQRSEDIRFRYLSVDYSNLDAWVGISGFDIQRKNDEISMKYKTPDSIPVFVSSELVLFIVFSTSYSPFALTEVDVKQKAHIMIAPAQERNLGEYQTIVRRIQDFLTLANMEPIYPLSIEGETGNKTSYPKIKIFYQLPRVHKAAFETSTFRPLFTLKTISDKLGHFLQNWFGKAEQLEPVYQLYFGYIYNPHMYLEQKFLSLVQALESYHRRTMQNYELPEDKHNERIYKIVDAVPQEHKKWLSRKLKYSNEPDLQRRLRELLNTHPVVAFDLKRNKESFIEKAVVTRNYIVHYDPKLEEKAAKGEELHSITRRLQFLVESCLLEELGFSPDEVQDFLPAKYPDMKPKGT
jgi:hypothetical protein